MDYKLYEDTFDTVYYLSQIICNDYDKDVFGLIELTNTIMLYTQNNFVSKDGQFKKRVVLDILEKLITNDIVYIDENTQKDMYTFYDSKISSYIDFSIIFAKNYKDATKWYHCLFKCVKRS